jgi:large subunit ribosomal protein L5
MKSIKEIQKDAYKTLKEKFGYKNVMQSPKLVKVVLSSGTGKVTDKKRKEYIGDKLTKIAGQKSAVRAAKKSISTFKVRQGDNIGFQVTLRGEKMFAFLDKLIHVALPRTKDFRGLKSASIDGMGNVTFGIKEHTIFPECADEDIKDTFSFAFTVVVTSKKREETKTFLELLGFPFSK